jgi:hypothetical protein
MHFKYTYYVLTLWLNIWGPADGDSLALVINLWKMRAKKCIAYQMVNQPACRAKKLYVHHMHVLFNTFDSCSGRFHALTTLKFLLYYINMT